MKNFWIHLVALCFDKEGGLKKRMFFSILLITIGLGIMIWFLIRLLYYEDYWNTENDINLTDAGQLGDFLGGLSGTIFTLVGVVLLFETLALQREELAESRKVFEKQQFENTFFNLLNLYQEVVKGLHFENITNYEQKTYKSKEFFEHHQKIFYSNFVSKGSIQKNRKEATIQYLNFYTTTKEQTAHYFRTLYRIFRFIASTNFDDKTKEVYSKIVRAQLSESECLFLHYNAFTEYGSKFRQLINTFNILKHLPTLEKVEFKDYAIKLNHLEKNSVQLLLDDTKKFIKSSLDTNKDNHKTYLQGSISLMTKSSKKSSFILTIIKKLNVAVHNTHQQGQGLQVFSNLELESFFKDYLIDLLSYSNYFEFNKKYLKIVSNVNHNIIGQKYTIEITVNNSNDQSIKFN
jgi:hypothetical protein